MPTDEAKPDLNLPTGWSPVEDVEQQAMFERELYGEVQAGHPLYGIMVKTLARRDGRDDFLFAVESEPPRWAVVHLTWVYVRYGRPDTPPWPATQLFESVEAWHRADEDDE